MLQIQEMLTKFAKKGMTPSQIGVMLRDSHGIAQVKSITGNKILRMLKGQGEPRRRRTPQPRLHLRCRRARRRQPGAAPAAGGVGTIG